LSDGSNNTSHGITFVGALQVLFIALKLTGYIDWPWWQVLLPIIIQLVLIVLSLLILGCAAFKELR
jgi:hypothetical protein